MRLRIALAGTALLAAAACSEGAQDRAAEAAREAALAETERPDTEPASPSPASTAQDAPGTALPPADAERRYVGRWASRKDLCTGGAWVFARDSFGMEDGPMCDFDKVSTVPGGYRITAQCEGPRGERSQSTFTLTFAESARAMLVEDLASLPATGLIYCGPG